jgi:hypothetical protein
MPSIQHNSRASKLLAELREEDGLSFDRLALLIGVRVEALRDCRDHKQLLAPVAQVRLARAVASRVPRLAAQARRLEEQALAAASLEVGANRLHLTAPAKWY